MSDASTSGSITPEKSVEVESKEIPVQDSPETPLTPRAPVNISLASQKHRSDKKLVGGVWTKYMNSTPLYNPPSIEVAKKFLRTAFASNEIKLPAKFRKLSSDTPVTSRQFARALSSPVQAVVTPVSTVNRGTPAAANMQTRVQTCHGCHLVMGGGNHIGSAPGKNVCSFRHSDLCLGGIPESDNWKGCPADYVSRYHSYNGTGFSQTLGVQDFRAPYSSTPAGAPGPALVSEQSQLHGQHQPLQDQMLHVRSPYVGGAQQLGLGGEDFGLMGAAGVDHDFPPDVSGGGVLEDELLEAHRFHRQANGEGARTRSRVIERVPSRVNFQERIVSGQQVDPFLQGLEEDVADLRAHNQHAAQVAHQVQNQPNLTMRNIRSTAGMAGVVENQLDEIRNVAPTLSSAPSAPAPGISAGSLFQTTPQPGSAYQYSAQQLFQQNGDGIRVRGSSPPIGVSVGLDHQLADARARFAAI